MAKLWADDLREAPAGFLWCRSVNETKRELQRLEQAGEPVELLDLDYDAGARAGEGGDFIAVLEWMEETGRSYPIRLHTQDQQGRNRMQLLIYANDWKQKD